MTQPENDDVAVDEVLSTPATPGAQALPSTEDGVDGDDTSEQ